MRGLIAFLLLSFSSSYALAQTYYEGSADYNAITKDETGFHPSPADVCSSVIGLVQERLDGRVVSYHSYTTRSTGVDGVCKYKLNNGTILTSTMRWQNRLCNTSYRHETSFSIPGPVIQGSDGSALLAPDQVMEACYAGCMYDQVSTSPQSCYLDSPGASTGFCNYQYKANANACDSTDIDPAKEGAPLSTYVPPDTGGDTGGGDTGGGDTGGGDTGGGNTGGGDTGGTGGNTGGTGGNTGGTGGNTGGTGDDAGDDGLFLRPDNSLEAPTFAASMQSMVNGIKSSPIISAIDNVGVSPGGNCTVGSAQTFFGTLSFDSFCQLMPGLLSGLSIVFLAMWAWVSIRVLLSA